jgi:hypothetical protein
MPRSREEARKGVEREVRAKLDKLGPPWLPMPFHEGSHWGQLPEWNEYHERQRWQHAHDPDYIKKWRRPSTETAETVWKILAKHGLRIETLLPPVYLRITPAEQVEIVLTIKQALVLALDAFVVSGHSPFVGDDKARVRTITVNRIFDVLGLGWSDHFRTVVEAGRADRARDMLPTTVKAARRDLLRNGIDAKAIWDVVACEWSERAGQNPLYWTERIGVKQGRRVTLKPGRALADFERHILENRGYEREGLGRMLLPADKTGRVRVADKDACMEVPYNVIESGPRAGKVIQILERARLSFNVAQFRADYLTAGEDVRAQFGSTYEQTASMPDTLPIKTRIYRLINRRYQAAHVWPMSVSGRIERCSEVMIPARARTRNGRWLSLGHPALTLDSSMRGRWFRFVTPDPESPLEDPAALLGMDVSSSQTAILAILLGLSQLENIACKGSFNEYLAHRAWQDRTIFLNITGTDVDYADENDPRLILLVKQLWMRVLYGAPTAWTVLGQWKDSAEVGPGWAKSTRKGQITHAASKFLNSIPQYKNIRQFLRACRRIAGRVNLYRGFEFTDPFDETCVRWNPVERTDKYLNSGGFQLLVSVPGKRTKAQVNLESSETVPSELVENEPDPVTGDYPIDRNGLRKMIAPCLTHALDAAFAGHLVEQLDRKGVCDIVLIHDAFFTPGEIGDAFEAASWEWFKRLGSVYSDLLKDLAPGDRTFRPLLEAAQANWETRVTDPQRAPKFFMKLDAPVGDWREVTGA